MLWESAAVEAWEESGLKAESVLGVSLNWGSLWDN